MEMKTRNNMLPTKQYFATLLYVADTIVFPYNSLNSFMLYISHCQAVID